MRALTSRFWDTVVAAFAELRLRRVRYLVTNVVAGVVPNLDDSNNSRLA